MNITETETLYSKKGAATCRHTALLPGTTKAT